MTCIVGIEDAGVVYVGADAAGTDDDFSIASRRDEKVFINDTFIMGFTDSFRMGQLLQYALDIPEKPAKKSDMDYLVVDFMVAVRDTFKEHGYLHKDDGREDGGTFLVGFNGTLYTVHEDFQVGSSIDGYAAVGCGDAYALGSLHSTKDYEFAPRERIRMALEASAHHNAAVRKPFKILQLGTPKEVDEE